MKRARTEEPVFFSSPPAFRRWLARHHSDSTELWVGFYKVATGKPSMTWNESVDEALCFGWIDGVRKGIDDESYKMRFSPRRARSIWSTKNVKSVRRLIAEGRMMPAGLEAFEARTAERTGVYSFEPNEIPPFPPELAKRFETSPGGWRHFTSQPPGYQKIMRHWVMAAKREATRLKRIDRLIEVSKRGERVDLLSPFREGKR